MRRFFRYIFLFLLFWNFAAAVNSSGILFYAFKDEKAYLLLSKDMHHDDATAGSWTDCGGKIDPGLAALNNAAKEGHEESMGVFGNPPKTGESAKSYDSHPEKNEKNKRSEIEGWIKTRGLPFEQHFKNGDTYSGWFVRVNCIDISYFENALTNLKKRNVAHHYTEKGGYAWVEASKFVGIPFPVKGTVTKIDAAFPPKKINIYYIFVNSMRTDAAQAHLKKIISEIQATPVPQPGPQPGLINLLPEGTYVVKNFIEETVGGTGGTKNPIAWLYGPSEMVDKNELGEKFDAVLISKKDQEDKAFKFEVIQNSITWNFNYIELDPNPSELLRGVFLWKCDFPDESDRYLFRRIGKTKLFVPEWQRPNAEVNEYILPDKSLSQRYSALVYKDTGKKYDPSNHPVHPFNFKVKKLVGGKQEGPEYLVDFDKTPPEIISVEGEVEQPKSEPQPQPEGLQAELGQLKNGLAALKGKLGALSGKLGELKGKLGGAKTGGFISPLVTKDIVIDGKKYCTCEFWKLSDLEASVKDKPALGKTHGFNVISDANIDVARVMKDPANNGAVFQIAANDGLPWTWTSGGVQAGAVVKATELGNFIRENANNKKLFEKSFKDSLLPDRLGTTVGLAADIGNILVAIHSGLSVQGVPGQVVHVPFVAAYNGSAPIENVKNCLKVAYDGTLLAAIHLGAPNVFLTLMGVGVFNNPVEEAIAAIDSAVTAYVKKYGLNVTVLYRGSNPKTKADLLKIADKIK